MIIMKNLRLPCFCVLMIFSLGSCDCDQSDTPYGPVNINGVDPYPNSAYFDQVVANFNLTQTVTTYSPQTLSFKKCYDPKSVVTLNIRNLTDKTINFPYRINFTLNYNYWNYENVATIPPEGLINVGIINYNLPVITQGSLSVNPTGPITYK